MYAQSVCTTTLMLGMVGGAIGCSEILNIDAFSDRTTTAVGGGGSGGAGGSGGSGGMAGTDLPAPTWLYPGKVEDLVVTLAPSRLFQRGVVASAAESIAFCTIDADLADQNAKDALSNHPGCPNSPVIETTPYSVINPLQPERAYYAKLRACADPNATVCGPWSDVLRVDTDNSVLLWLRLDDMTGDIAADSGPLGLTAMLIGFDLTMAWVSGILMGALRFDGIDDYLNLGDNFNLDSDDPRSFEMWSNRSAVGNDVTFLGRQDLSNDTLSRGYWLGYKDTNQVWFQMINDASSNNMLDVLTVAQFNTPNIPQNILVTYDGSSLATGVKIYVDAVDQPTTAPSDALSGTTLNPASFRIGSTVAPGGIPTSTAFNYPGVMDEIAVYNRALTQAEAINNFCAQNPSSSLCE